MLLTYGRCAIIVPKIYSTVARSDINAYGMQMLCLTSALEFIISQEPFPLKLTGGVLHQHPKYLPRKPNQSSILRLRRLSRLAQSVAQSFPPAITKHDASKLALEGSRLYFIENNQHFSQGLDPEDWT